MVLQAAIAQNIIQGSYKNQPIGNGSQAEMH